jgi:hypothetical protein
MEAMDGWDGLLTNCWMNVKWGDVPKNETKNEEGLSDHMKNGHWFPHPQVETWHKIIICKMQQSIKREWEGRKGLLLLIVGINCPIRCQRSKQMRRQNNKKAYIFLMQPETCGCGVMRPLGVLHLKGKLGAFGSLSEVIFPGGMPPTELASKLLKSCLTCTKGNIF